MSRLRLEAVSKSYGSYEVLRDVSLEMSTGDRLAILGPSGCGKTTLLRIICGLDTSDNGRIFIGDQLASEGKCSFIEPSRRDLSLVFQDLALWPHLTVRENIEFGLKARRISRAERQRRIAEILEVVRLPDYANIKPGKLSGGQQQRVAMARALVLTPSLLLMDEPFSSLDRELRSHLIEQLLILQKKYEFALVTVTHDYEDVERMRMRSLYLRHERDESGD